MNSKLRNACLDKTMLRNKYFKYGRTNYLWDPYRKIRIQVTKLKATSMYSYFFLGKMQYRNFSEKSLEIVANN